MFFVCHETICERRNTQRKNFSQIKTGMCLVLKTISEKRNPTNTKIFKNRQVHDYEPMLLSQVRNERNTGPHVHHRKPECEKPSQSTLLSSPMSSKKTKKKRRLENIFPLYTEDLGTEGFKRSAMATWTVLQSSNFHLPLTEDEEHRQWFGIKLHLLLTWRTNRQLARMTLMKVHHLTATMKTTNVWNSLKRQQTNSKLSAFSTISFRILQMSWTIWKPWSIYNTIKMPPILYCSHHRGHKEPTEKSTCNITSSIPPKESRTRFLPSGEHM